MAESAHDAVPCGMDFSGKKRPIRYGFCAVCQSVVKNTKGCPAGAPPPHSREGNGAA